MSSALPVLTLNLKGEFFDEIKAGTKSEEFREVTPYWCARLLDEKGDFKRFSRVVVRRGYPKKNDNGRELIRPWVGVRLRTIVHPHFGDEPVRVFAIRVG
mgnify:CR=1 FL=1